jgi:transposase
MGKFRRKDQQHQQGEFWVPAAKLTSGPKDHFYARLQKVLDGMDFTGQIHRICEPHYQAGNGKAGRPPIDPAVFFKMMMVGFLEGIPSDRGIAARCSDSLTLRRFLGYSLTEETPDHSSFTVIRQRLPHEAFAAAHEVVLEGLRAHGLLKGRNLGIDSSDMEANASLSGLVRRNTEESYRDYVRNLARAAGVDSDDPAAVARFDRRREGRKTSNAEWYNPHESDAKVGRTKHGACDMLHKPEHMVDLDSGAIVAAEVRPGDAGDSEDLSTRVIEAAELVEDLHGQAPEQGASRVKSLTTDKGFHDPAELAIIQHELGVRTIIGDAHAPRRNLDRLEPEARAAVVKAARAVASQSGKALLKKRGEMIERSFAHVLDSGGQRRTTLRGLANINKRYLCAIMGFNLGLILRKLTGVGTPRQAAAAKAAFLVLCRWLLELLTTLWRTASAPFRPWQGNFPAAPGLAWNFPDFTSAGGNALNSTGS